MISIKIFQSTLPREERHSAVKSTSCPMLISIHAPTRGATNLLCFLFAKMRFQSTLPREERLRQASREKRTLFYFNPRSHERSDSAILLFPIPYRNFNPRSHERSDKFITIVLPPLYDFNPRSHERSDRPSVPLPLGSDHDFNPRSHERSDLSSSLASLGNVISIHAPTRGATSYHKLCCSDQGISIHAPTRGATKYPPFSECHYGISIHAPTRGATKEAATTIEGSLFQSTLPREERRICTGTSLLHSYFNPRSHERSDELIEFLVNGIAISIHAPTRGATI